MSNITNIDGFRNKKLAKEVQDKAEKSIQESKFIQSLMVKYIIPMYCELTDKHINIVRDEMKTDGSNTHIELMHMIKTLKILRNRALNNEDLPPLN
jgi:hypothetical protein